MPTSALAPLGAMCNFWQDRTTICELAPRCDKTNRHPAPTVAVRIRSQYQKAWPLSVGSMKPHLYQPHSSVFYFQWGTGNNSSGCPQHQLNYSTLPPIMDASLMAHPPCILDLHTKLRSQLGLDVPPQSPAGVAQAFAAATEAIASESYSC